MVFKDNSYGITWRNYIHAYHLKKTHAKKFNLILLNLIRWYFKVMVIMWRKPKQKNIISFYLNLITFLDDIFKLWLSNNLKTEIHTLRKAMLKSN